MRRHIVFLPGYYGSRLLDRVSNTLFWLSTFTIQKPEHTLAGIALPASDGRVVVDGIVDDVKILPFFKIPVYHPFIAFLVHGMGYAPEEIHAIGIDFRRSLTGLVDVVSKAIDDAFTASGEPVDLIAHSHGGLVARAYLDRFGAAKVSKLITLGVPHLGMLETFKALCEGISLLRFNPAQLKEVARGFPSAYELLPLDSGHGYFKWNHAAASPFSVDAWCETPAMKQMLADAANVSPALSRNVPVPLFAIHGTRSETLVSAEGPTTGATGVAFGTDDKGDGTVPLASGAAEGLTAPGGVKRFAVPFGGHAVIFNDRNTQEVVRHILREDPAPEAYFVAAWQDTMYLPHADNRVVVEFADLSGAPVQNATVTLTLLDAGVTNQPLPQQASGDYLLTVRMPGAGTRTRYVIRATAPGISVPFEAKGILVAAAN